MATSFSFKTPINHSQISLEQQKRNNWVTRNLHKIPWESGKRDVLDIPELLNCIKSPGFLYYAKGKQKCKLLSMLLQEEVSDLDDLGCPKIAELHKNQNLDDSKRNFRCKAYPMEHMNCLHCALRKAVCYYKWMSTL